MKRLTFKIFRIRMPDTFPAFFMSLRRYIIMQVFDGFIAAVASEFNIKFNKKSEGIYTTRIEFDNNRSQDVLVTLGNDESGDRIISYFSIIAKLKQKSNDFFEYALKMNATLDYGAIALMENALVLRSNMLLRNCEPDRFFKSLTYVAAKADELEEKLTHKDGY
jgi:hypothetical protein